jgi:hypothetical protein
MKRPSLRRGIVLPAFLGALGCGVQAVPLHPLDGPPEAPPELGAKFDAMQTGTIRGRVLWTGPAPVSHSYLNAKVTSPTFAAKFDPINPLVPRVHPQSRGVAGAVVFLREVDPERSRPWDLPPTHVTIRDAQIVVGPGEGAPVAGFVRRGGSVEMVSELAKPETLRAGGAAFFSLAFPETGKPLSRSFPKPGLVELSSGTGNYWARAFLFVADHPYYTRTDAEGHFALGNVPDGTYELVCWQPNWRVERFERDPENLYVTRLWYAAPLEKSMAVRVERGAVTEVEFRASEQEFVRPESQGGQRPESNNSGH